MTLLMMMHDFLMKWKEMRKRLLSKRAQKMKDLKLMGHSMNLQLKIQNQNDSLTNNNEM